MSRNPFFIRSVFVHRRKADLIYEEKSQSLFHQVCVRSQTTGRWTGGTRRNPFFIRSVFVQGRLLEYSRGFLSQSLFHQVCVRSLGRKDIFLPISGRNPFFIRSVFVPLAPEGKQAGEGVAIPFSSGLCSFRKERHFPSDQCVAIPFSSGLCSFGRRYIL